MKKPLESICHFWSTIKIQNTTSSKNESKNNTHLIWLKWEFHSESTWENSPVQAICPILTSPQHIVHLWDENTSCSQLPARTLFRIFDKFCYGLDSKFDMFIFMPKHGVREGPIEAIAIPIQFLRTNIYWAIFWIKCVGNFVQITISGQYIGPHYTQIIGFFVLVLHKNNKQQKKKQTNIYLFCICNHLFKNRSFLFKFVKKLEKHLRFDSNLIMTLQN